MLKKIFLMLLFFILVTGCSNINVEKDADVNVSNKSTQVGMVLGLYDESATDSKQTIHKIKANEAYTPEIYIKSNFPDEYNYRLFFFKDYEECEVFIDDKTKSSFIDIKLKPSGEKSFQVKLPLVEEGLHDFIIIAVRDPDNTLDKEQYVDPTQVYLSRRVALISGEIKPPKNIDYTLINSNDSHDIYSEPFISLKNIKVTVASLIPKGFLKSAIINMGSTDENKRFALITLLGTKQISFGKDFIEIKKPGNFEIELSDFQFNSSEAQNAIIVLIENPFTTDEIELLREDIKFTNLITITP